MRRALPAHWRSALRSARGALPLVVAMLLLAALVGAGTRHFYCSGMDAVLDAPCCSHHDHSAGDDAAALHPADPDCCAAFGSPSLPSSTTVDAAPATPPPGVVAVLVAAPAAAAPVGVARAALASRACGPPPAPGEARARLMVFVI